MTHMNWAPSSWQSWAEAVRRAMDFRKRFGDNRFVDVSFADLQTDPIAPLESGYDQLGLTFTGEARRRVQDVGRPGTSQGRAANTATISPTTALPRSRCASGSPTTSRLTTRPHE